MNETNLSRESLFLLMCMNPTMDQWLDFFPLQEIDVSIKTTYDLHFLFISNYRMILKLFPLIEERNPELIQTTYLNHSFLIHMIKYSYDQSVDISEIQQFTMKLFERNIINYHFFYVLCDQFVKMIRDKQVHTFYSDLLLKCYRLYQNGQLHTSMDIKVMLKKIDEKLNSSFSILFISDEFPRPKIIDTPITKKNRFHMTPSFVFTVCSWNMYSGNCSHTKEINDDVEY
jgi:hypothetical protein